MKYYKLIVHPKTFENSDLLLNKKDFPNFKSGDIVEIYHPEDEFSRLLLQITKFKEDLQGKDVISVEQTVATTFQLRTYSDVIVNKVKSSTVMLDSVEVTFKDQYLDRSEMWRVKNYLVDTCVYINKKIEFRGGTVRIQVYEMWCRGEKVACGVITLETKIVFRSSTSMVYLFIQMSSEMWEFDIYGDLYFEKTVNGFLTDVFQKWKKYGCNHEVTIVLFSRVFYKANSVEEFPEYMRECLQKDFRNRFYEDFYRVAVQNEKYEDWSGTLILLQTLFTGYQKMVLEYHEKPGYKIPPAYLSRAAHGNFLEVLNISLNVFEKHYLERSLDRTGQLVVVISPGVGVFEVDRELTNVTKQRIIDNGVGNDLVCVGEQPLHAVPLFKFYNKDPTIMRDDYSMPHWINISFYSSDKKLAHSRFIPRIRLQPCKSKNSNIRNFLPSIIQPKLPTDILEESSILGVNITPADVDYDSYDAQIFAMPSSRIMNIQTHLNRAKKLNSILDGKLRRRKLSDADIYRSHQLLSNGTTSITRSISECRPINNNILFQNNSLEGNKTSSIDFLDEDEMSPSSQMLTNSTDSPINFTWNSSQSNFFPSVYSEDINIPFLHLRALINPFDPSHITIKMTSNRRRWTHIFPKGPTGLVIQRHHYQPRGSVHDEEAQDVVESNDKLYSDVEDSTSIRSTASTGFHSLSYDGFTIDAPFNPRKTQALLWGVTGEQKWTPTLLTGVDWKSLVLPACLPITTDYFPDEVSLKTDYLFSNYNLLPEDVNADYARKRAIYRAPLTTREVFNELISQRLAQGFQAIVETDSNFASSTNLFALILRGTSSDGVVEYKLSIGRIFHKLSLCKSEIVITRYRPRHPYPPFVIHYRYRFQAPDHTTYGISWASFKAEKLENFNWNYLDHYICTRGDTDYSLVESCKYWRFRLYALPSYQPATKQILDGSEYCDLYKPLSQEDKINLLEGFLKFVETAVNKIKRPTNQKNFKEKNAVMNRSFDKNSHINNETRRPIHSITNSEIIEMLQHPTQGINFLSKYPSLPSRTFVSYDAIQWLMYNFCGFSCELDAASKLEELRKEKLICHASGDFLHPFIVGFYLYYIPRKQNAKQCKEKKDFTEPIRDIVIFKNEWAEIETLLDTLPVCSIPLFLSDELEELSNIDPAPLSIVEWPVPPYKQVHLEMDVNDKSDKIEWGHARYQSVYRVGEAFELIIEWVVASGSIVSDLIYSLSRKAQTYNLQLVPVPADPHALPYTLKSDPLRGPVFVPLNIESIMGNKNFLFEEYPESTRNKRLLLLQEEIALRFGFIQCNDSNEYGDRYRHSQFVHLTGNIFLMIISSANNSSIYQESSRCPSTTSKSINIGKNYVDETNEITISPHQEYITRHVVDIHNDDSFKTDNRIGYLWSWNHMIGRRWKGSNQATNDEAFQDKLLSDFRQFCNNSNKRLVSFWQECNALKNKTCES